MNCWKILEIYFKENKMDNQQPSARFLRRFND
nr:MAG TPA: hypothetical protein [Caudoviricetes sp.]